MRKALGFMIVTYVCSGIGMANDIKIPASPVQQPPAAVFLTAGTTQPMITTPKSVVKTALESLKSIVNSKQEKSQQFGRMKNFSGCFLHPDIKQKVMMTLILGGMKSYAIVKESFLQTGAKVEVDIQLDKEKTRVVFELVYRKKAWWITRMN